MENYVPRSQPVNLFEIPCRRNQALSSLTKVFKFNYSNGDRLRKMCDGPTLLVYMWLQRSFKNGP